MNKILLLVAVAFSLSAHAGQVKKQNGNGEGLINKIVREGGCPVMGGVPFSKWKEKDFNARSSKQFEENGCEGIITKKAKDGNKQVMLETNCSNVLVGVTHDFYPMDNTRHYKIQGTGNEGNMRKVRFDLSRKLSYNGQDDFNIVVSSNSGKSCAIFTLKY